MCDELKLEQLLALPRLKRQPQQSAISKPNPNQFTEPFSAKEIKLLKSLGFTIDKPPHLATLSSGDGSIRVLLRRVRGQQEWALTIALPSNKVIFGTATEVL
jgi:hypothetical protein